MSSSCVRAFALHKVKYLEKKSEYLPFSKPAFSLTRSLSCLHPRRNICPNLRLAGVRSAHRGALQT